MARAAARAALQNRVSARVKLARALAVAAHAVSGGNPTARSSAAINVRCNDTVMAHMETVTTTMMVYGVSCARLVNNQRLRLMRFPCTNPSVQSSALKTKKTHAR